MQRGVRNQIRSDPLDCGARPLALVIGNEGMLAVTTEVTVKLVLKP
jgi:hypothetical protein